jgi:hypothetical protein
MRVGPRSRVAAAVALAVAGILAAGCAWSPGATEPLATPESSQPVGPFAHNSGMSFPETAGRFVRSDVTRFDKAGDDVAANYDTDRTRPIVATVYVYPMGTGTGYNVSGFLCQHEFDGIIDTILKRPDAREPRVIERKAVVLREAGNRHDGNVARFEYESSRDYGPVPVRSEMYLFCVNGKWFIEYRFTYPRALDASADIAEFMEQLVWGIK